MLNEFWEEVPESEEEGLDEAIDEIAEMETVHLRLQLEE